MTAPTLPTGYQAKPDELYMNPAQQDYFRGLLLEWRRSLMEEVDRTLLHMQDGSTAHPDPNDRASQEEEFSLELRTRDRERKLLRKINETLNQIDADEYGYCENCGAEIGLGRLQARPTATLCIDCKTQQEAHERQHRG